MTVGNEILRTDGLVKAYRGRRVVDHVAIGVREGEIVGLLGPNGAGKTTTFRMVVGMVTPDAGRVLLGGKDVTGLPMYKRARQGLGYLAQQESVFKKMSAIDNIRCVLEARGMKRAERETRAQELLQDLQLTHVADSIAETMSGGEKRRLEPLITLAKEPTLANRRLAFDRTRDRDIVVKLFGELGPRYKARPGGYTRILKMGFRVGDNAPMAFVELVDRPEPVVADATDATQE